MLSTAQFVQMGHEVMMVQCHMHVEKRWEKTAASGLSALWTRA
jgi:hypothetical protein